MKSKICVIFDIKKLLLVDGIGAMISAILLAGIVANNESIFGMPKQIVLILVVPPVLYATYSFGIYLFVHKNHGKYLKTIAIANLAYCALSMGYVYYYFDYLTALGLVYFIGEVLIIFTLVCIELKSIELGVLQKFGVVSKRND